LAKYNTDKVVKLQGKEYILFEGLLEIAHAEWELAGIETTMVQAPSKENGHEAIIHAVVRTKDGKTFSGYGDASPNNVNKMIVPHIIRMAETRAIGRALRFLTGFGTVFEELGDLDEVNQEAKNSHKQGEQNSEPKASSAPKATKAQIGKIEKDAKAKGLSVEQVLDHLGINIGLSEVNRVQASEIIKFLMSDEVERLVGVEIQDDDLPF